jgi:ATP-dependent RNA helicase RhlE
VSDIEKLIKKKLEIEAIELEDDRPARVARPPRARDDDEELAAPRSVERSRYESPRRMVMPSRDPFFDKPYEPSSSDASPAWEAAAKVAPTLPGNMGSRGLSPNIRPKKKVASLLGGR